MKAQQFGKITKMKLRPEQSSTVKRLCDLAEAFCRLWVENRQMRRELARRNRGLLQRVLSMSEPQPKKPSMVLRPYGLLEAANQNETVSNMDRINPLHPPVVARVWHVGHDRWKKTLCLRTTSSYLTDEAIALKRQNTSLKQALAKYRVNLV